MFRSNTMKWLAVACISLVAIAFAKAGERGEHGRGWCEREGKMMEDLGLTEEQEAQVHQILDTHHQAVENWRSENEAACESLRQRFHEAKEAGDEEALAELGEEMEQLKAGRKELHESLRSELAGVLSAEQMEQVEARIHRHGRFMHHARGFADHMDMTDEQREQAKAIMAEAHEQARQADSEEQKHEIFRQAKDRIYDEVLTDEQRAKVDKMKERFEKHRFPEGMRLTEEQLEQIRAIHEEAKEKIYSEVLTDEQRQWLDENPPHRPGPWHWRHGPPDGPTERPPVE